MLATNITFFLLKILDTIGGPMFLHLGSRGVESILWVLNSESELDRALAYQGVSGIMTDIPENFIHLTQKS